MRRILPAIGLFLLSPLVAEYLLGDLPLTALYALVMLAPMYGGAALLVREVCRRFGWGWPSILTLALAYSVVESSRSLATGGTSRGSAGSASRSPRSSARLVRLSTSPGHASRAASPPHRRSCS
ncbi:hypothetical protein [Actinopolymorpha singaporensis]|uniref:Uncharacterized protein n=1 Tax=Actinopolymorpha singaporensis TaxID=117157 RepID=A0A1H1MK19_9ACTN|nr:hypothetical protein [Actinopolymorpha singaporensis]SDR86962.1 hypothetical protein SAMN04489717_0854 [Actinopolymorpha singaporensis]